MSALAYMPIYKTTSTKSPNHNLPQPCIENTVILYCGASELRLARGIDNYTNRSRIELWVRSLNPEVSCRRPMNAEKTLV